jgi:hypothetical protein
MTVLSNVKGGVTFPRWTRPRPYVISSDGKTMYVAVSYLHGFDIVSITDKKVLQRVEMSADTRDPAPA